MLKLSNYDIDEIIIPDRDCSIVQLIIGELFYITDFEMPKDRSLEGWSPYARRYDPLKAGSIDGTDTVPHDKAISRAMEARYEPPRGLDSEPERTVFVGRLSPSISKLDLREYFSRHGDVLSVKIILDIVTGMPQGYAFIEMRKEEQARRAVRRLHDTVLNGCRLFVDYELGRTMEGWKPRRLGGGFGGKKESGQLRFGGKDRPFKKPILPESTTR